MNKAEQQFLSELDNKFWKAADKLRSNMDAANYKHGTGAHLPGSTFLMLLRLVSRN